MTSRNANRGLGLSRCPISAAAAPSAGPHMSAGPGRNGRGPRWSHAEAPLPGWPPVAQAPLVNGKHDHVHLDHPAGRRTGLPDDLVNALVLRHPQGTDLILGG